MQFFRDLFKHLGAWAEAYVWAPLAIVSVALFAKYSYFLTGRRPLDNGFDYVGLGDKTIICVILIMLLSITRQASGTWFTKDELYAKPRLLLEQDLSRLAFALLYTYILTRA